MDGKPSNSLPEIRVVLADDHQVVRVGIKKILSRTEDIRVVGEAVNGVDAINMVIEHKPQILLLDIEMPGVSGLGVAQRLREAGSDVKILVLSGYDDREYIHALLEEDIAGYLVKGESPERIITAIRAIAHGSGGWYSTQIAPNIADWDSKHV